MNKVYFFDDNRSKLDGTSVSKQKKEIYQGICDECKKEFPLKKLELEHIIPVKIGGSLIDKNNLRLICKKCHPKKTNVDILIINFFKKAKISDKGLLFLSPEEVKEIYFYLLKKIIKSKERYKLWEEGINGEDYEQIIWKLNRGGENEQN